MPRAQAADLNSPEEKYLLVEGVDDWHVHNHIKVGDFGIGYCGNDEEVLQKLSAVVVGSASTKSVLGAILDADADTGVSARLQSIKDRLHTAYDLPEVFPAEGLIVRPKERHPNKDRLPVIGVWLMPDNVQDGIFEDLLCLALNRESHTYIAQVVDQAKNDGKATFRPVERAKVIVKTHITWQDPNMKNYGEALGSHFENLNLACKRFLEWQNRLFGSEASAAS